MFRSNLLHYLGIVTAAAVLLCAGCEEGKLDFTGKTPEQVASAIKASSSKITSATIIPSTDGPLVADIAWLASSGPSPILMESPEILKTIKAIATAKGDGNFKWILLELNDTGVDKLGNKSTVLTVNLFWDMDTLKKINWDNFQNWQLIELATIQKIGPFGNKALTKYCEEGRETYASEFCRRAGM